MTETRKSPARTVPDWVGYLKLAVFDIAGPLIVFQLAKRSGMDEVTALLLSGIPPLIGIVLEFWLKRRVEAIGVFVIVGIAIGAALALLTDDPRLYLLEGAGKTGAMALVLCGSVLFHKPAFYLFWLGSLGGPDTVRGRWLQETMETQPGMSRLMNRATLAFGGMLLFVAVSDAVIAWTQSTETSLLWNRIDFIPGAILFTVAFVWLVHRAQQRGEVDFNSMPTGKKGAGSARTESEVGTDGDGGTATPDTATEGTGSAGR